MGIFDRTPDNRPLSPYEKKARERREYERERVVSNLGRGADEMFPGMTLEDILFLRDEHPEEVKKIMGEQYCLLEDIKL